MHIHTHARSVLIIIDHLNIQGYFWRITHAPKATIYIMETTTLDACFKKYVSAENFHLLDNEITDEKHISQIADEITDWKDLRSYFEISYPTQQVIINDNPRKL